MGIGAMCVGSVGLGIVLVGFGRDRTEIQRPDSH